MNDSLNGLSITAIPGSSPQAPLILLNSFGDEWLGVHKILTDTEFPDHSLLCISRLDWNYDLSPWEADHVFRGEEAFGGGADEYLSSLVEDLLPRACEMYGLYPSAVYIAGYSMAGLFALYSLYKTDVFSGCACCSGSLWFPGFLEYCSEHSFAGSSPLVYLSLGDKEALTKNKVMATVEDNTRKIFSRCKALGAECMFELNPGGHFKDPEARLVRGIRYLLEADKTDNP